MEQEDQEGLGSAGPPGEPVQLLPQGIPDEVSSMTADFVRMLLTVSAPYTSRAAASSA